MKIVAVIQARFGSTRLPGKVMMKVKGKTLLEILVCRLSKSKYITEIVIATTSNPEDDAVCREAERLKIYCFRGSQNDVLDRYYQAAVSAEQPDIVLRITGDCPLIDPGLVDQVVSELLEKDFDICGNAYPATFPDGLDVEAFKFSVLETTWKNAISGYDREHVTPYMHTDKKFKEGSVINDTDYSELRWTVDEIEDFHVIENIIHHFNDFDFDWKEILTLSKQQPELFMENMNIKRNEGAMLGTGQKLWKRAKKIIPGGNMLLSKRSEMFLPDLWPSYFSRAKQCYVWDLDDNQFIDMSIMGIGTNTLGYGHPEVDEAVQEVVRKGNMSTFNCPEEVYLAEKLIELHPWADMARFTRSGGEANAVAVRIARAAAGKDGVAICGYHGWHDWYLAANLSSDKELNGHLLPGLQPNGVPEGLTGTIYPFQYNKIEQLEALIVTGHIGVIFMEVMRNVEPENGFLEKVRALATQNNIVLVFDECTSGFRQTYGGLHKKYNVTPDIAMFGKALGNGYAINAVIGKREVMEAAQTTFISSTFWTERIGPAAGVATLKVMEEIRSWETINNIGEDVAKRWKSLAENKKIDIQVTGLPALAAFSFNHENALVYKTYITQQMLENGILSSNSVYACIDHSKELLDKYFDLLDTLFDEISTDQYREESQIKNQLKGPVCHSGFKRLN